MPPVSRRDARGAVVPTTAVVLTGAPGTGKTSVLAALGTLLEVEGTPFGAFECEELARGWPWLSPDVWLPQLAAVMALQRAAGRRLFLVAATTETTADLRGVVEAAGAERTAVVVLVAPPEVVQARLAAREPESWPGKARLIAHARELARTMPRELEGVHARIVTDGRRAADVAADIRALLARFSTTAAEGTSAPGHRTERP